MAWVLVGGIRPGFAHNWHKYSGDVTAFRHTLGSSANILVMYAMSTPLQLVTVKSEIQQVVLKWKP